MSDIRRVNLEGGCAFARKLPPIAIDVSNVAYVVLNTTRYVYIREIDKAYVSRPYAVVRRRVASAIDPFHGGKLIQKESAFVL